VTTLAGLPTQLSAWRKLGARHPQLGASLPQLGASLPQEHSRTFPNLEDLLVHSRTSIEDLLPVSTNLSRSFPREDPLPSLFQPPEDPLPRSHASFLRPRSNLSSLSVLIPPIRQRLSAAECARFQGGEDVTVPVLALSFLLILPLRFLFSRFFRSIACL
jgi:hypothetical protein